MPETARTLRRALPVVLLLALVAIGASVVGFLNRPPAVDVAEVRRETVQRTLAVTGRLRPATRYTLVPLVSGRLVALGVAEGDRVRRGAVVARVDDEADRAALAQAESRLAAHGTTLEQARRDLVRAESLHARALVPDQTLEEARRDLEGAVATAGALRAAAREARARLADHVLRSPVDGWVLERPVDPGQTVTPATTVVEVAAAEDPLIEADVDEQFLAELRIGMPALAAPLTGRRLPLRAQVVHIGRRVESASGAVPVRLRFVDRAPDLPAGLSLDVNLDIERHPDAVTVPRHAVAGLGVRPWVLVVAGDRTVRRDIDIIDWPSERVVVLAGLSPGEHVVLDVRRVPVGARVRPRLVTDGL